MNIWRLGTNWEGMRRVLDLILQSKIGFFGIDWSTDGVNEDDIIAIAKPGKKIIVAIGIAATQVQPLSELLEPHEQEGDLSEWLYKAKGFRFKKIWHIPDEMQFSTADYKQFYSLRKDAEAWEKAIKVVAFLQREEKMRKLCQLLENCHNLILTGAPGTGKTYLAMELANAITGDSKDTPVSKRHSCFIQFHPSYDYADFVEGLRPTKPNEDGNIGFVRQDGTFKSFCKRAIENQNNNFKDAYQALLKELVENYSKEKPLELKTEGLGKTFKVYRNSQDGLGLITGASSDVQGSLTAEKIESFLTSSPYPYWEGYYRGVLKYLKEHLNLNTSTEPTDQKYVFIIDEINRGDIAKIFGELFFALDPGYRGQKEHCVITQYSNLIEEGDVFKDGFYIPKNVYVIGTMNDIDRNVESMDFAVRRRFTWKQIAPEDTQDAILAGLGAEVEAEAKLRMNRLNTAIRAEKSQLGENFCIGAAYFRKVDDSPEKWGNLWNYHLKPLLEEYVRGLPDADKLMKKFEVAYDGKMQSDANTNAQ